MGLSAHDPTLIEEAGERDAEFVRELAASLGLPCTAERFDVPSYGRERGYSDELRRAIMSHTEYSGVSRDTPMEKALFACDELAGFITAVALIKPGKSLAEVDVKSVRKRMKDKAFARKVNRDDIINGAKDLGVDLDEHIAFCIAALKPVAKELGLDGSAAQAPPERNSVQA